MGCTVREKHFRTNRRARSGAARPELTSDNPHPTCCCCAKSIIESGSKPMAFHDPAHNHHHHHHHHIPHPVSSDSNTPAVDENSWGYCTEEQLEEILMKNLELLYKEAVAKLVGLGYDEDVAMKAILRNGHCYGGMDVLTNILHNSLAYLNSNYNGTNSGAGNGNGNPVGPVDESVESAFSDLRQLQEYSLAGMVCLLQQVRPHLSRGDAMWCLLMSDLHLGRASSIEVPLGNGTTGNGSNGNGNGTVQSGIEGGDGGRSDSSNGNGVGVMPPALCRFHGGWGFGSGRESEFMVNGVLSYDGDMSLSLKRDIECPKRFNLSPSMKSLLKRNVAMFAAGFRANSKHMQTLPQGQSQACMSLLPGGDLAHAVNGGGTLVDKAEESRDLRNIDGVSSMLSKFRDLNLDENLENAGEDQKDEMIVSLLHQIKDLEKQVEERKEWAHQKAMQAARRLSNDLTELKILRMEREETQRLKKGKQTLEDSTMKRLSEMENALRKASGQVDRANASVRRLETENAEIKAEMEASKLSASESATTCLEVAKREKKCLKKLLAWEKQKTKLQEEIAEQKEKIKELQQCLAMIEQAQKDAEDKWRLEVKAKEQALTQVEEERRSKEAAEANSKRKLEALRLKIEIDFQRHKDDLQRLEQELSRLRSSVGTTELNHQLNALPAGKTERTKSNGDTIARLLNQLDEQEDLPDKGAGYDRECIICLKDEVSVVFLPCAHQVMCASCSDNYGKKGKATCPCCRAPIEQRIRVFGASS